LCKNGDYFRIAPGVSAAGPCFEVMANFESTQFWMLNSTSSCASNNEAVVESKLKKMHDIFNGMKTATKGASKIVQSSKHDVLGGNFEVFLQQKISPGKARFSTTRVSY
jgi:hypothetical protein